MAGNPVYMKPSGLPGMRLSGSGWRARNRAMDSSCTCGISLQTYVAVITFWRSAWNVAIVFGKYEKRSSTSGLLTAHRVVSGPFPARRNAPVGNVPDRFSGGAHVWMRTFPDVSIRQSLNCEGELKTYQVREFQTRINDSAAPCFATPFSNGLECASSAPYWMRNPALCWGSIRTVRSQLVKRWV